MASERQGSSSESGDSSSTSGSSEETEKEKKEDKNWSGNIFSCNKFWLNQFQ